MCPCEVANLPPLDSPSCRAELATVVRRLARRFADHPEAKSAAGADLGRAALKRAFLVCVFFTKSAQFEWGFDYEYAF